MDVAIKRGGKGAGFAVIRNYAPARIERELLAQVFDIVQQGAPLHVASQASASAQVCGPVGRVPRHDDAANQQDAN